MNNQVLVQQLLHEGLFPGLNFLRGQAKFFNSDATPASSAVYVLMVELSDGSDYAIQAFLSADKTWEAGENIQKRHNLPGWRIIPGHLPPLSKPTSGLKR